MGDIDAGSLADSLRALAHPLRLRILSLMTGQELSAAEVAEQLAVSHGLASYHVRQLHQAGYLELAGVGAGRGRARRYRYRPPNALPPASSADDTAAQSALVRTMLREAERRVAALDGSQAVLTVDAELWVDESDLEQAHDEIRTTAARLHDRAVPRGRPGAALAALTVVGFRMAAGSPPP